MSRFAESCTLRVAIALSLASATLISAPTIAQESESESVEHALPPVNPWLAPSASPMAHRNSAQQDSSLTRGPEGPTRTLTEDEIDWFFTGPGHYGALTGVPSTNGQRIDWTSGRNAIVKYDSDSYEVLASLQIGAPPFFTEEQGDAALARVFDAPPEGRPMAAAMLAAQIQRDLVGIYSLVDRDGNFIVGEAEGLTMYGSEDPDDPQSDIVVLRTWEAPPINGKLIGINMTYDGWIVLVSEGGDVLLVSRNFAEHRQVRLNHAEAEVDAYNTNARESGNPGYTWVRNSYPVDEEGGIYVLSANHVHKVIWNGERLSIDEADGAWTAAYPNSSGFGSGATPALMGFGPEEDHLIAFSDGDDVMNVVVYWRDEIPEGWEQLPGAPSRRMAGSVRADMGNPEATAVQTEQATIVSGYRALVVNNEPASTPPNFPPAARRVLVGLTGADPRFTPHGLQMMQWNPDTDSLELAWTSDVASPNVVPFISAGSGLVYTMGAREGNWTLEGIDWDTGESAFHYVLPGEKYNGFYSGLMQDDNGDILFGTPFGRGRIAANLDATRCSRREC